jgi:CheY-like chemotaxis protein/two-component sensor histidine kinase
MTAQRAARVKDEFLATLSHELRSPLSAILGWTQILLKHGDAIGAKELQRAVEVIDRNARAQVQLIDDLLDLSRIMTGKLRLDLQQIEILNVVQAAIESAEPAAQAKDIRLKSILDPVADATVSADAARLQQVVWNLLTNAIKFTPKGGQVQVLLQRVNSHVELSVSDTGIGIPPNFLPHVFDRFSQRDSSTTRSYGGLGLGLAISKQLVELHGGSIRVASQGEGKGSTFFVHLPLSIVQLEDENAERVHPTANSGADDLPLPKLNGVHVFVVDDEPDARDLLRRVLEHNEATVTVHDSAQSALNALKHTRPSVIVSDIGMPQMDGYQLMRALRATEPPGQRIPALALTAFARSEDRKRSLLAGYQAHIAKPFDVGELVLLIADLVGR